MLTYESSGDVAVPDPSLVAEATGAYYESQADGSCTGEPIDSESSPLALQEPVGLLPGLVGAEEAGSETANEVTANHYTFDQRALAESGRAETNGEVWVAVEGGYLVRFVRTSRADASYWGEGMDGVMTWDYELTAINQPLDIELPAGCQVDAPAMPDAVNLLNLPRSMGYDTPSSVADVTAFYREQLPSQGWTIQEDPLDGEGGSLTRFAKGNDVLNVVVNTGEDGTRVDILLTTAE